MNALVTLENVQIELKSLRTTVATVLVEQAYLRDSLSAKATENMKLQLEIDEIRTNLIEKLVMMCYCTEPLHHQIFMFLNNRRHFITRR